MAESLWNGPVKLQSKNFPERFIGMNAEGEAFIFGKGKRFELMTPGLTGEDGTISFKSSDKDNHYLRHYYADLYDEDREDNRNPGSFDEDATFRIHRDMWHEGFFCFEAVNFPGRFIRHQNARLKISDEAEEPDVDLFHNDASFRSLEGPYKLQSKNFPDYQMGLAGDTGVIKNDGEEFYLVRPGLHGEVSLLPCCGCQDHMMRHYGGELFSENPEDCRNQDCMADDASYNLQMDQFEDGYFALESVNFPGRFIRHCNAKLRIDEDDGSDLMHNDASFRTVKGPVMLKSYNFPDRGIGFDGDSQGFMQDDVKPFWLVTPGLTKENGTVSFESCERPNSYLRHYNALLDLEEKNDDARNADMLPQDGTFRIKEDMWFDDTVCFESVNFPGYYIRHQNARLKVHQFDGSDLFKKDASFTL